MLQSELSIQTMLDVATYTKAPDWSYEKEWRMTSFKRPTDTGPFTDYKFNAKELAAIYLGPMISPANRNAIIALASGYPDVCVWNISIGMNRELEFNAVEG